MTKKIVVVLLVTTISLLAMLVVAYTDCLADPYPRLEVSVTPDNPIDQCERTLVYFDFQHPAEAQGAQPNQVYIVFFDSLNQNVPAHCQVGSQQGITAECLPFATSAQTVGTTTARRMRPYVIVGYNTTFQDIGAAFVAFYPNGTIATSGIKLLDFEDCSNQPYTFPILTLGSGFSGPTPVPEPQGDPANPYYPYKVVARWDDPVPFEIIGGRYGPDTKNICVVAAHSSSDNGIARVEISANDGDWISVDQITVNPETGIPGYCVTLDTDLITPETRNIEVRAKVFPIVGRPLVLQGPMTHTIETSLGSVDTGKHSKWLIANKTRTNGRRYYPETTVYLHNTLGNNSTCVAEDPARPCLDFDRAIQLIMAGNQQAGLAPYRVDAGRIYVLPSPEPYAFGRVPLPYGLNPTTADTYLTVQGLGNREQIVFNRAIPFYTIAGILADKTWVENVTVRHDVGMAPNGTIICGGGNHPPSEQDHQLVIKNIIYRGAYLWATPFWPTKLAGGVRYYASDVEYWNESEGLLGAAYANNIKFKGRLLGKAYENILAVYNTLWLGDINANGVALGPPAVAGLPFENHPDLIRQSWKDDPGDPENTLNGMYYNGIVAPDAFISAQGLFFSGAGIASDTAFIGGHWRSGGLNRPEPYFGHAVNMGENFRNFFFQGVKFGDTPPSRVGALEWSSNIIAENVVFDPYCEFPNGKIRRGGTQIWQIPGVIYQQGDDGLPSNNEPINNEETIEDVDSTYQQDKDASTSD